MGINTIYASTGKNITGIEEFFQNCIVTKFDDGYTIQPDNLAGSAKVNIKYRDNETADEFTGGLLTHFSNIETKQIALKNRLLAQIYYTDTVIKLEGDNYTVYKLIMDFKALCEELQGFMVDSEGDFLAEAFENPKSLSVYSGVFYSNKNAFHDRGSSLPHLCIHSKTVQDLPHFNDEFDDIYKSQQEYKKILDTIPASDRAFDAFNDGRYLKGKRMLEKIPQDQRTVEDIAVLGMIYYALSYNKPNAVSERQRALDTILSVNGEGNCTWHYALSYVLSIADPAKSVEHMKKASNEYPANDYMIERKLAQVNLNQTVKNAVEENNKKKQLKEQFKGFSFTDFWEDSSYALENYVFPVDSDEEFNKLTEQMNKQLGYKLPQSYLTLMRHHNGGKPKKRFHKTATATTWSDKGAEVTNFYALGDQSNYTLCGGLGSRFMIEEWNYPDIGVYIGATPTAGHDMIALDYRYCGSEGEPAVVHVAQEDYFAITFIAKDFETYVRGLELVEEE